MSDLRALCVLEVVCAVGCVILFLGTLDPGYLYPTALALVMLWVTALLTDEETETRR